MYFVPTLGLWEFILDHVMASAVLASLGPGPLVPRPSGPQILCSTSLQLWNERRHS